MDVVVSHTDTGTD